MSLKFKEDSNRLFHIQKLIDKYTLLALNIFKWTNLPGNLESRHIEKALFNSGQATFYNDENFGFICLPSSEGGKLNVYGESKNVIVNGNNFSKVVNIIDKENDVIKDFENATKGIKILNNDLALPTFHYVQGYAQDMFEVENAIKINIKQQKFPYIVNTTSNNELSMKNLISDVEQGKFAFYVSKAFNKDDIDVLNLNTPYVADKLNQYKYDLEREILTFFGLNNAYEKKERMLVDEVNSNNDYISRNVELMYKCRVESCKLINSIYGLNIGVEKIDLFHNENKEDFEEMEDLENE